MIARAAGVHSTSDAKNSKRRPAAKPSASITRSTYLSRQLLPSANIAMIDGSSNGVNAVYPARCRNRIISAILTVVRSLFPSPLIELDVRRYRIRLSDWLHREAHDGAVNGRRSRRRSPRSPWTISQENRLAALQPFVGCRCKRDLGHRRIYGFTA
jgi:hypothetical protein